MTICLGFITHNRLEYSKLALQSVLDDPTEQFSLFIWDNASTDGTAEYLKHDANDPRIVDIVFSKENIGQTAAISKIWSSSKTNLLGKLDNDCLVTAGWTRILAEAHKDIANLGVVACWHFLPEDFDLQRAKHKIQRFGNHQILRHAWTCGTGFLIKSSTFKKFGRIHGDNMTRYWQRIAKAGYINGFYYPLIYQEHMDDPVSKYSLLKDDDAIKSMRDTTYSIKYHDIKTLQESIKLRKVFIDNILNDPWDANYYIGWRPRLRRAAAKIAKSVRLPLSI